MCVRGGRRHSYLFITRPRHRTCTHPLAPAHSHRIPCYFDTAPPAAFLVPPPCQLSPSWYAHPATLVTAALAFWEPMAYTATTSTASPSSMPHQLTSLLSSAGGISTLTSSPRSPRSLGPGWSTAVR